MIPSIFPWWAYPLIVVWATIGILLGLCILGKAADLILDVLHEREQRGRS